MIDTAAGWNHLVTIEFKSDFFGMQFQDLIEFNLNSDVGLQGYSPRPELWATSCYYFWYWRNIQQHHDSFVYTCKPWKKSVTIGRNTNLPTFNLIPLEIMSKRKFM